MSHDRFEGLIDTLRQSVVFSADFPRRERYSHAEWVRLDQEERTQAQVLGYSISRQIRQIENVYDLTGAVDQLGRAKQAAAVPLLAELWANCAVGAVRNSAGHALRAIGTPEARRALWDLIEDSDRLSVSLAVAAVFDEDDATAFDRFSRYFEPDRVAQPGGDVIPDTVLMTFAPNSVSFEGTPIWMAPRAPSWLREDPRWIRLCVALRHDKQLGETSRRVLRYADPNLVVPALEEAKAAEGPRVVRIVTKGSGDLLARYLRGEHE